MPARVLSIRAMLPRSQTASWEWKLSQSWGLRFESTQLSGVQELLMGPERTACRNWQKFSKPSLTVCEAGLLAPSGPISSSSRAANSGPSKLNLSVFACYLGPATWNKPPPFVPFDPAPSCRLAADDYQVKTGAQEWQPRRVTADQRQTWHCGFTTLPSYFSDTGWWHTGLTDRQGPYRPGSEGTYSYQFLLIALKIPQPRPAANSHAPSGRSASFRASPGRALAPKLGPLRLMIFLWAPWGDLPFLHSPSLGWRLIRPSVLFLFPS